MELNPWRGHRECRYMGVVGTHTGNHADTENIGYLSIWRWLLPPIHGIVPTQGNTGNVQKDHSHRVHSLRLPEIPMLPAWVPVWVLTTIMYLHSLHEFNSCNSLHLAHSPHHHVPTFPAFSSVVGSLCRFPLLPCIYIPCVFLHGFQFPAWFPAWLPGWFRTWFLAFIV